MKTLLKIYYYKRQGVHRMLAQLFPFSHQFSSNCKYIYMWIAEGEVYKLVLHNIWAYEPPKAAKENEICTACKIQLVFPCKENKITLLEPYTKLHVTSDSKVGWVFLEIFHFVSIVANSSLVCVAGVPFIHHVSDTIWIVSELSFMFLCLQQLISSWLVIHIFFKYTTVMDLWKVILINCITYYRT